MQNKFNHKWIIPALGILLAGLLMISCKKKIYRSSCTGGTGYRGQYQY